MRSTFFLGQWRPARLGAKQSDRSDAGGRSFVADCGNHRVQILARMVSTSRNGATSEAGLVHSRVRVASRSNRLVPLMWATWAISGPRSSPWRSHDSTHSQGATVPSIRHLNSTWTAFRPWTRNQSILTQCRGTALQIRRTTGNSPEPTECTGLRH